MPRRRSLLALATLLGLGALGWAVWSHQHGPGPGGSRKTATTRLQRPKPTPPAPGLLRPLPERIFWQGAGVIVAQAQAFGPQKAPLLARDHFRWVAVKIHHGLKLERANLFLLKAWARGFHQQGLSVCGWGAGGTHPAREGRLAVALVRRYQLDCYIVDAEAPYMGLGYGGRSSRSRVFVRSFRNELPRLPAAVTTMGAAHGRNVYPFDYGAWARGHFALLPQAYLSITTDYCPQCTLDNAERSGFPLPRVHPMIGIGWSQGRPAQSARDYDWRLARLVEGGTRGFSVFLGETTSDHDFDVLGRAIERYGIAR